MDEVTRKLELLDKRLRGRWWFLGDLISTSPLFLITISLITGIIVQSYLNISILLWLATGFIVLVMGGIICGLKVISSQYRSVISVGIAVVCALCLGSVRLTSFNSAPANDIRNYVSEERVLATIRGEIISEPYLQNNSGWAFERFVFTDQASSFYLKLS